MKRISFFLVLTLILSFGLANAEQSVSVSSVDGYHYELTLGPTTDGHCLSLNAPAVFHINFTNDEQPDCFYSVAQGYSISDGGGGAMWTDLAIGVDEFVRIDTLFGGLVIDTIYFDDASIFNSGVFTEIQDGGAPGEGTDLIGFSGVATSGGLQQLSANVYKISFVPTVDNSIICFDQAVAMASYEWIWSGLSLGAGTCSGDVEPVFTGAQCYTVAQPLDMGPEFDAGLPVTVEGSHCENLTATFTAFDPDPGMGPGPDDISYSVDLGTIDGAGNWSYMSGDIADVGASITLTVTATEADNAAKPTDYVVNLVFTNNAPTFTAGCDANVVVGVDALSTITFDATDDCAGDPMTFSVVDNGGVAGAAAFVGNVLEFTPAAGDDALSPITMEVAVSDGVDQSTCFVTYQVIVGSEYEVTIEKTHNTPQGQFVAVDVTLDAQAEAIGAFNFLIAYDASALTFQGASVDNAYFYTDCGWEYFTYRFGPDGNCGNGCPSGLVRVVGIAETNNGPIHPTPGCNGAEEVLFSLNFLVTNDRTFECMYVPIRFFWIECGDNTIASEDGATLFVNDVIKDFDYDNTGLTNLEDYDGTLPTYLGAPNECVTSDKLEVKRAIGFTNGGVDIVCAKDIDDRGDINMNGLAYEVADAVMFTNYFIEGLSAFGDYVAGAVAATDVNADGLTLSVADLVYLIRVIVGDAVEYDNPFQKLNAVNADMVIKNGVVNVNTELGAALFVFEGDVAVNLIADGVDMISRFDGENKRVLVYSLDGVPFTGDIIDAKGTLVSSEMAASNGAPVNTTLVPADFALNQNYPNPFNPSTTLSFALPFASDYTVTIYNVTGQVVDAINGSHGAGVVELEYDASDLASGIYFYKLDAGSFSDTKKMVLMK